MNTDNDGPEQVLATTLDRLNNARYSLTKLRSALHNEIGDRDKWTKMANDALAEVDLVIEMDALAKLAREELTRLAACELSSEIQAQLNPGAADTLN